MGKIFLTVLCFLFLLVAPSSAEHNGVGLVKVISGRVDVYRENATQYLSLGAAVYTDDVIRTSTFGSVGISFLDGTMLSLGSNGEITIDEFVFDPLAGELTFSTRLTIGILTYVSGTIGKLHPKGVTVRTPLATIGIRGTRFIVAVETP